MSSRIAILAFALAYCPFALGQHGQAEPGFYTFDYHGDTWTGEITAIDHAKAVLTLTYKHKDKLETFRGVIKPPLQVIDKDGNRAPAQVRVKVGDRITAYYIKEGSRYSTKDGGKTHYEVADANLIFQIKLLGP